MRVAFIRFCGKLTQRKKGQALDTEMEVCKSRYGYIRVEFHGTGELPGYCSGMVCHTPKELFDLLLSDYESYLEIQRT
ncbi:MAG: hypothetical protein HFE95_09750, partial [Acutalibacter sp.]|nr:hypothetical protein [Acutalibacter sp.]